MVSPPIMYVTALRPAVRDTCLAAVVAVALVVAVLVEPAPALPAQRPETSPAVLVGLSVAVAAPLAVRLRFPLTVAVVTSAVALLGMPVPGWSGRLVAMAALSSAAYHRPHRLVVLLAVSACSYYPHVMVTARPSGVSAIGQVIVYGLAPVAVGYALRLHRDRAEQRARLHRAEADRAAAEERLRIAGEVHDAVGHHLTAIRMQARAAQHVLGNRAGDGTSVTGRALDTIAASASVALREVRTLLDTLRAGHGARPGLAQVTELATRLATPDQQILVHREGRAEPLPGPADHGAYRIIQEALTNAVRHSGAGRVEVWLRQTRRQLTITIADDGPTHPPTTTEHRAGHGIRGMRERARLLGGTLVITPRRPHGWQVQATLPIDGHPPTTRREVAR